MEPVPVDPTGTEGPTKGQARGPGWRRTSPGLYVPSSTSASPEQRILEQSRRLPPGGAVGGWAALRLHGAAWFDGSTLPHGPAVFETLEDAPVGGSRPVPLWLPAGARMRPSAGSVVHRGRAVRMDVVGRHGVPCLRPEPALLEEAAAASGVRDAVTVLDMGLSAGVTTVVRLREHLSGRRGSRGVRQARLALEQAEDRVLSPRESWLRLVWVLDAGLPRPRCNWPVADLTGRRLGRPDLLCEELGVAVEYDGAEHRTRSRHGQDVRRESDFRDAGLEVVTVVATDVPHPARVVARMVAAVERARAADRPRGWMRAARPGRL